MKTQMKRILSLIMVLVMVVGLLPVIHTHAETEASEAVELSAQAYEKADDIFAQIDALEAAPAKKSASETELTDAAAELVMASENYVEGSLERNGNVFTWWTTEGVRCLYNPRMRQIREEMVAPEDPLADGVYNEPMATKGGWPSSNQVYLIGPYYGSDSNFTDQYKNEAAAIATAIGDTDGYTLYSGTAATVDTVATAMSNGAVVIFDSHGTTDYENEEDEYDFVTGASNSFLCLASTAGLTDADYAVGALYGGGDAYINGATIANHMQSDSPGGILWMAICLGMATDTLCEPLRARGVEVVYGYSQSVFFETDYMWEELFWDNMCAGASVATAIADMKQQCGSWEYSAEMYDYNDWEADKYGPLTMDQARGYYYAFPVVVSDEDPYPGQRGVDSTYGACSPQTVKSTYTLFAQYTVNATSSNTSYGTVSVSGNTITATPATGYFAQSATVTSGTATVTQNGNSFTVTASSDCTVQINFAPKTQVTVSFSGASVAAQTGYAGDAMTLPTATAPEGFTFLGWTTSRLTADTTEKPACYTGSFTPTASTTLYALYTYYVGGTGGTDYVLTDIENISATDEVVITMDYSGKVYALSSANGDNGGPAHIIVQVSDDKLTAQPDTDLQWNVTGTAGAYSFNALGNTKQLYVKDTNDGVRVGTNSNNTFTIATDSSGTYLRNNQTNRYVGVYRSGSDWRCYTSIHDNISGGTLGFYVKGAGGTTYYTSDPVKCDHASTTNVAATAATCTQAGYTAGVWCNDCESYISGHETIPATGHSYNNGVITQSPTCTETGVKIFTCATCGDTYTQSVAATGHDYQAVVTPPTATQAGYTTYTCSVCSDSYVGDTVYIVSFSVPEGVAAVSAMECGQSGITLPTAEAPEGYTFAGWTVAPLEATETAPDIYPAGQLCTTDGNVTLYALYTYVVEQEGGSTQFTLVTQESQLTAGAELVIATSSQGFVAGDINSQYLDEYSATFSADLSVIESLPTEALILTLGGSQGSWTLANADGDLLGATAEKKLAWGSGTTTWSISVSDDGATIQNATSSYGKFLYNVQSPRFTTYTSSANTKMLLPQLYVRQSAGTTYYTTLSQTQEEEDSDVTWGLILGEQIGVKFNLTLNEDDVVTFQVEQSTPVSYTMGTDVAMNDDGSYTVILPLAAARMTEQITVSVNGEMWEETYSVRKYADTVLADPQLSQYHNLVRHMLHYGAASQLYFGHNVDDLANTGITLNTTYSVPATCTGPVITGSQEGVRFHGASLVYKDRIAVRFYFAVEEGYTLTGENFQTKGDLYYVDFTNINPQDMDATLTVTVGGLSVSYSPLDYIVRINGKSADGSVGKNLVQALYGYYQAAEALTA